MSFNRKRVSFFLPLFSFPVSARLTKKIPCCSLLFLFQVFSFFLVLLIAVLFLSSLDCVEGKKKKKSTKSGKSKKIVEAEEIVGKFANKEEPVVEPAKPKKAKKVVEEEEAPKAPAVPVVPQAPVEPKKVEPRVHFTPSVEAPEDPAVRERRLAALREKRAKRSAIRHRESRKSNEDLRKNRLAREKRLKAQQAREKAKVASLKPQNNAETRDPEQRKKGLEKLRWLDRESARAPGKMIAIDSANYQNIVLDGYRPYYLYLAFTALTSANNCPICHEANRGAQWVAAAHFEKRKASLDSGAAIDDEIPIYFINVDVAKHGQLFQEMKIATAPQILVLPPKYSNKTAKAQGFLTSVPAKYRFSLTASVSPNEIDSFVFKTSQLRAPLGQNNAVTSEEIIIGGLCLAVAIFLIYNYFDSIVSLRNHRSIRYFVCWVCYCVYGWCISGGMYNIIKGNIFAGQDNEGKIQYINGDARDQFGAEGLILGVLNVFAAVFLVMANTRAYSSPPVGKITKSPFQNLWNAISPLFSPLVCQVTAAALWLLVIEIYTVKNRGYNRGFVWF